MPFTKHVIHLIIQLEVFEIDFFPTTQLHRLKDLEVEQLELIVGDERGLAQVQHLLRNVIEK